MVDFAGWWMPLQYSGHRAEHEAVRQGAGIFDLSHMGEIRVEGEGSEASLRRALITDPSGLAVGRAHYSMLCSEGGGVLDDLIVYRLGSDRFLVVANANNSDLVFGELQERAIAGSTIVRDDSGATALIAIQGPQARPVLERVARRDLAGLRYYSITDAEVGGVPALVARTGYTGEDGFELFVDSSSGPALWDCLMQAGADSGLTPAGLAARDTLRLEAGMALYGNELTPETTPVEAGLGRLIDFAKPGGFVGREALETAVAAGSDEQLVGLVMRERGIARHDHPVLDAETVVGRVTSGTYSPTLERAIAMAYVDAAVAAVGTRLDVDVRGKAVAAEVVRLPFYRRAKEAGP